MSAPGDRHDEVFGDDELDTDFDMLLDGVAIDPRLVPLTRIVDDVQIVAGGAPPSPTADLAAVLRGDLVVDEELSPGAASAGRTARRCAPPSRRPASGPRSRARIPSRLGAMSLTGKAALGLVVAGAGAVGAGVTGVLPDPAADVVRRAVEAITPFELRDASAHERDDQGAPSSGDTQPDQIDPGTANAEVTSDDAPAPDAGEAETPGDAQHLRSPDRSDDAEPANAPATRESVAEGERGADEPPLTSTTPGPASGGGKPTGGPVPGHGGPSSGGGSGSPSQAGDPPDHRPQGDAGPPSAAGRPAGAGAPPDTGARPDSTPAPTRQQTPPPQGAPAGAASSPTAGPRGGGPAGDPSSASDGAAPAAQAPGAGPPPAPGR